MEEKSTVISPTRDHLERDATAKELEASAEFDRAFAELLVGEVAQVLTDAGQSTDLRGTIRAWDSAFIQKEHRRGSRPAEVYLQYFDPQPAAETIRQEYSFKEHPTYGAKSAYFSLSKKVKMLPTPAPRIHQSRPRMMPTQFGGWWLPWRLEILSTPVEVLLLRTLQSLNEGAPGQAGGPFRV